jgi:hypothetical protein
VTPEAILSRRNEELQLRGIKYGMYEDFILVILNPLPPYTIKGDYKVGGR